MHDLFTKIQSPEHCLHPLLPPKMGISETEFDIRWQITLQQNFTSTIAALIHYEGPYSCQPPKAREL